MRSPRRELGETRTVTVEPRVCASCLTFLLFLFFFHMQVPMLTPNPPPHLAHNAQHDTQAESGIATQLLGMGPVTLLPHLSSTGLFI